MKFIVGLLLAIAMAPSAAHAMDTKAAGRCVALGTLSRSYEAKAEALLSAAAARGEGALVQLRAREEFAYLARIKHDQKGKEAWTFSAVTACGQF
jgi:hypothetical protein